MLLIVFANALSIHISPIMERILQEGRENGIYRTEYPRQTAKLMVLYGKALVEPNMLPLATSEELKLRTQVFMQLMIGWLLPAPEHVKEIIALFDQMLPEIQRERAIGQNEKE